MNSEHEKKLADLVGRELDRLGELSAPPALAGRILRQLQAGQALPWYRRAWSTWPLAWQLAGVVGFLAIFSAIYLGLGPLTHGLAATSAGQKAGGWLGQFEFVWNTLEVLARAGSAFVNHLGRNVIVGGLLVIMAGYAACVGLSSAFVRYALNRN